jgi:hypothetical protein
LLLIRLCIHILGDLFRCPLQWAVNLVCSSAPKQEGSILKNLDSCVLNDICIVLHHYAPRGLSFSKSAGGADYFVGVGVVLDQLKDQGLSVNCFVADATEDYLLKLKHRFPKFNFIATEGKKYDFFSYLKAPDIAASNDYKYYCMLNDNVDYKSNIIEFMKSAKCSMANSRIGMVGVGSNTFLTQSFFKKSFSPHIQTYGFFIKKNIFDKFATDFKWFLTSLESKMLLKSAICRLLEQGLSKSVLIESYSLGFIQKNRLTTYRRRLKYLDIEKDWNSTTDDYRNSCASPFLFSGLDDLSQS